MHCGYSKEMLRTVNFIYLCNNICCTARSNGVYKLFYYVLRSRAERVDQNIIIIYYMQVLQIIQNSEKRVAAIVTRWT